MQIHLKSRGRREKEQVPSATGFASLSSPAPPNHPVIPLPPLPSLFLLRIARLSRQMPRLISALPLAQQLSNKPDISAGLLSVFCVTGRVGVALWDVGWRWVGWGLGGRAGNS